MPFQFELTLCNATGAIPFIALSPPIAQALPLLPADLVASAGLLQIGYGASIASFLGGIHWAMAMAHYGGKHAPWTAQVLFTDSIQDRLTL